MKVRVFSNAQIDAKDVGIKAFEAVMEITVRLKDRSVVEMILNNEVAKELSLALQEALELELGTVTHGEDTEAEVEQDLDYLSKDED